MTPLMAWALSGAGMIPSLRANVMAASNTASWAYASASTNPSL